jgi:hypothetical protein
VRLKIPIEWYEILYKLSKNKRIKLSDLILEIIRSEECLGLEYVKPSRYKVINLSIYITENERNIEDKIKRYLFCR